MERFKLKIRDSIFDVSVVSDKVAMKIGLSDTPSLEKGEGMLFDFGDPQKVTMNTVHMQYPIDLLFIDEDNIVSAVRTLKPGNFETTVENIMFVLEVNEGEGSGFVGEQVTYEKDLFELLGFKTEYDIDEDDYIMDDEDDDEEEEASQDIHNKQPSLNIVINVSSIPDQYKQMFRGGGSFKMYEEDVKADHKAMQVLDDTGKVLMNIVGGERIFSIPHTEALVAMAKKVERGEAKPEELGKLMQSIIKIQDTQKPEYV
jgi:uncharacterized membrane protein (UPF0127 family)